MASVFDPRKKVLANLDHVLPLLEGKNPAPLLIEVDPSNACNHGCYFCISSYIHLPESKNLETFDRSMMSKDMLMSACESIHNMGVKAVNWTGGGEPTLNPHLKGAISFLGSKKIKMGMFTNGTLLDKHDLFETLVDNMSWVRLSIDSGTKDTYNAIRRSRPGQDWDKMIANLTTLIDLNAKKGKKIDIGVGFVITPDTYTEIIDFANTFNSFDVSYCQFKPEIVNIEREDGVQRSVDFWEKDVQPLLDKAKKILGSKYAINDYKLDDLKNDPDYFGRTYKKCLGSQIQPCIGADGHVYVCTNLRGYKQYSYGSLDKSSLEEIWNNIQYRKKIMYNIEEVECFANCTQLCKPHESNKVIWDIKNNLTDSDYMEALRLEADSEDVPHKEFI
jgi:cyclic pyranopterin phosphate synthase